jgi:hypothetical protein
VTGPESPTLARGERSRSKADRPTRGRTPRSSASMSGRGRRNRGRGRSHGRGRGNKSDLSITKQQSKGAAPLLGLSDHVYDVGDPTNAGNFVKISKFLMTYIAKTYDHGARIAQSSEERRIVDEPLPQHQQSTSTDKQGKMNNTRR